MEKFAIEIETLVGWVNYHFIMRPGEQRAKEILKELQDKYPNAKFRVVKWIGEEVE
jgi:hypothetical protein